MASGNDARIVPPAVPMTITQIAVVVADIESALRSYTEHLGWGPWSVFDYKPPLLHDTVLRGQPFYYVDTAPLLKFVLESGSGHAIDLEPTYVYP
jgi:catechol 2,3-dioxygenase-like lactoylglutathione lyase family enzyme